MAMRVALATFVLDDCGQDTDGGDEDDPGDDPLLDGKVRDHQCSAVSAWAPPSRMESIQKAMESQPK